MKSKVVISLKKFLEMGGEPYKGMTLITNPDIYHFDYKSTSSRELTFLEMIDDLARIEECTTLKKPDTVFVIVDCKLSDQN